MVTSLSEALDIGALEKRLGVVGKAPATCEHHGEYIAISRNTGTVTGCPKCAEEIRRKQEAIDQAESAKRRERERLALRLGCALIPPRFADRSFDTYQATSEEQSAALAKCRRYAERFPENLAAGRCLLLVGNVGTGKTHLAAAIAKVVIAEHGKVALYSTVSRMCMRVKGSYDKDSGYTEQQALDDFQRPDLLIIDEVGAGRSASGEFERTVLFEIVNGRYERMLPTLVISNMTLDELKGEMGERVVDRLREGGGNVIPFTWASNRS